MSDLIETLMSEASELAQAAGAVTLEAFRASALSVEIKADGTEVTSADRDAEHLIREVIKLRYPDHSILGEEEDDLIGDANLTWIVDPIDGTKGFVRGVPLYTTLLAVADELGPMVGVSMYRCSGRPLLLAAVWVAGWMESGAKSAIEIISTAH